MRGTVHLITLAPGFIVLFGMSGADQSARRGSRSTGPPDHLPTRSSRLAAPTPRFAHQGL